MPVTFPPSMPREELADDSDPSKGAQLVGAQDGDGGSRWTTVRGFILYLLSSLGASIVGFMQAGVGGVLRSVLEKLRERVTPYDFGVVGDGVADDSAAVTKFFDYLNATEKTGIIPAGCLMRIVGTNYFLTGAASILGENRANAGFLIDGALSDSGKYLINCGIPSIGGTPKAWSGFIKGVKFTCRSTTGDWRYTIMLHYVRGCEVSANLFDYTPLVAGQQYPHSSVEGFNNNAYNSVSNIREDIRICDNEVKAKQDQNGGQGFGCNYGKRIFILNNTVRGMADDPVGLHGCDDFVIAGNKLYITDGRIYLGSCKNGLVYANRIERIAGGASGLYYGGGSYIQAEIENPVSLPQAPTNIDIFHNTLVVPAAAFSIAFYGIRVSGGRKVAIEGNKLICNSSSTLTYGISVEPKSGLTGWTDPDGIDAGTVCKSRDVAVAGNICSGLYPQTFGMNGTAADFIRTTITNNICKAFTSYFSGVSDTKFSGNATTDRDAAGFLNVAYSADTPVVATLVASPVQQSTQTAALVGGTAGFSALKVTRPLRIVAFRTLLSVELTAGSFGLEVSINGGAWTGADAISTGLLTKTTSFRTNAAYTLAAGDTIAVRAVGSGTMAPTTAARIEVLGFYE